MGWPPRSVTAPSVDTRVRVLLLLNIMATVLPVRELPRPASLSAFVTSALEAAAFRRSFVNSAGVKSLIAKRWRGLTELEEYALTPEQRVAAILAVRNILEVMMIERGRVVCDS